jgi:hypothetical protein
VQLDVEAVSAAIENGIVVRDADHWDDAVAEVVDALIATHGVEAVIAGLAHGRDDPLVAAALFEAYSQSDRRVTDLFSDEEIVEAALQHLLAVESGSANLRTGGWAWSALFRHFYDGGTDHFTDEEHFRVLLKLIDRAPLDDTVLFCIGDGPLSHASGGNPARREKIMQLAAADPKVARAWWLNVTDGGRLEP